MAGLAKTADRRHTFDISGSEQLFRFHAFSESASIIAVFSNWSAACRRTDESSQAGDSRAPRPHVVGCAIDKRASTLGGRTAKAGRVASLVRSRSVLQS